ncbi:MAG: LacI family DNA-binding transcriptional regulator [Bifidobacterium sp.]
MKDIAISAGVSVATVSRVLGGKDQGRIKPEIALRVREQAESMGYQMNPIARSLRTRKTRIIGFISDEIATTPFAGKIILGAQDAAQELGYVLLAANTNNDRDEEKRQIRTIKQYGAAGFIYAAMYHRKVTLPTELDGENVVIVDAEDNDPTHIYICPDERAIGYDATHYLAESRCSRIVYFGSDQPILAQRERLSGYSEALKHLNYPNSPQLIVNAGESGDAQDAASYVFSTLHPDGVFCFNDVRAAAIYRQARLHGVAIGRDCSVIGVDNNPFIGSILFPHLTSIELPHYEMGYWGVRRLVSRIEKRRLENVDVPRTVSVKQPPLGLDHVKMHCAVIKKDSVVQVKHAS